MRSNILLLVLACTVMAACHKNKATNCGLHANSPVDTLYINDTQHTARLPIYVYDNCNVGERLHDFAVYGGATIYLTARVPASDTQQLPFHDTVTFGYLQPMGIDKWGSYSVLFTPQYSVTVTALGYQVNTIIAYLPVNAAHSLSGSFNATGNGGNYTTRVSAYNSSTTTISFTSIPGLAATDSLVANVDALHKTLSIPSQTIGTNTYAGTGSVSGDSSPSQYKDTIRLNYTQNGNAVSAVMIRE